ncbi:hypothetical protein [Thalassotalea mangrovi]|uniref:Uncharacterized protein n=1 Tax=Thalassotalea mangrovi TaxID=2572245 RepID=A0A4U1B7X4_9GAMM|nr:hypothetical protein [Thalassotalea mangrovi]TKB46733.1 hypothetical protein E8M12_04025 [Thalassotalea mangrovi]
MESDIKSEIVGIFTKYKHSKDIEFVEENFLDFLIANPSDKGAFRNSFKGLRKYNHFIDEVQLKFGICFSIKDRETNFSLENFTLRVIQLMNSKRSSLKSLRNQMKQPFELNVFLIINLIGISIIAVLWGNKVIATVVVFLLIAINLKLAHFYHKEYSYQKRLKSRILNG